MPSWTGSLHHDLRSLQTVPARAGTCVDPRLACDDRGIALTREAGLSLGDRFCLALAVKLKAIALTADRAWVTVAERANVEVRPIR